MLYRVIAFLTRTVVVCLLDVKCFLLLIPSESSKVLVGNSDDVISCHISCLGTLVVPFYIRIRICTTQISVFLQKSATLANFKLMNLKIIYVLAIRFSLPLMA
jgi:hypothetical protein